MLKRLALAALALAFLATPAQPAAAQTAEQVWPPSRDFAPEGFDAFNRLRVSNQNILFSGVQTHRNALDFVTAVSGTATATWTSAESATVLTVGTASGEYAIVQSRLPFLYRAGQSTKIAMTATPGALHANTVQRIGLFDDDNGVFYEWRSTGLYGCTRTDASGSPVDSCTANPLTTEVDVGVANIYGIRLQWLGVGSVVYSLQLRGTATDVGAIHHANVVSRPYMRNPHLPARWEVRNTGVASGPTTMSAICGSVSREGGDEDPGIQSHVDRNASPAGLTTTFQSMLCVRVKSTHVPSVLKVLSIDVLNEANVPLHWHLSLNPTLDGVLSWSDVEPAASHSSEYSTTVLEVTDAGYILAGGYVGKTAGNTVGRTSGGVTLGVPTGSAVDGTADTMCLIARTLSSSGNAYGSIDFEESF